MEIRRADVIEKIMDSARFREDVKFLRMYLGTDDFLFGGGYLRDLVNDREIKDLDVYTGDIPNSPYFGEEEIDALRGSYNGERYQHAKLNGQASFFIGDREINVILGNYKPSAGGAVQDHFDTEICRIGYHPEEGFFIPHGFLRDINDRTITVRDRQWGYAGMIRHIERIQQKYPDFRLYDPHGTLDRAREAVASENEF